jgi:putative aminopeptidase FrvX
VGVVVLQIISAGVAPAHCSARPQSERWLNSHSGLGVLARAVSSAPLLLLKDDLLTTAEKHGMVLQLYGLQASDAQVCGSMEVGFAPTVSSTCVHFHTHASERM